MIDARPGKTLSAIGTGTIAKSTDMTSTSVDIVLPGAEIQKLPAGVELSLTVSLAGAEDHGPDLIAQPWASL